MSAEDGKGVVGASGQLGPSFQDVARFCEKYPNQVPRVVEFRPGVLTVVVWHPTEDGLTYYLLAYNETDPKEIHRLREFGERLCIALQQPLLREAFARGTPIAPLAKVTPRSRSLRKNRPGRGRLH